MEAATPYDDLERPPLRALALSRALAPEGWRLDVLPETPSTNAVVAEHQTAGRGRLDRTWVAPPRAGLTFSVLLRPDLPAARWSWIPLWAGLAVADAVRDRCGLATELKWPNDVLVGGKKVCGLLAEAPGDGALVLGIGLNVSTRAAELPHDGATSLQLAGATTTDRDTLLRAVLRSWSSVVRAADPQAYRARCGTLGRAVRLELPGGRSVEGTAETVDDDGRLVVDGTPYAAGDVVHLRPAG